MENNLEAAIDIDATPQDVWAVVADLKRMGEWSPQCKRMYIVGGTVAKGTRTINLNRRGPVFWPTTSKVVRFEPNKEVAFRIVENGVIWSFEIEPTETGVRLTERRTVPPAGTSKISQFLVTKVAGGNEAFETELNKGINNTLARIKQTVEAAKVA